MSTILHNIREVQTDRARQRVRKIVDRLLRHLDEFCLQAEYNPKARRPLYNIEKGNYGLNIFAFYNFQVLLTNVLSFILLLCVGHATFYPSEALPVEKLPKGTRWSTSGSDDDNEREEIYITPEHKVYMRLSNPEPHLDRDMHKKSATYIRRGKLFNRNGYLLRINSDGTVDGTTDKNSVFGECCR